MDTLKLPIIFRGLPKPDMVATYSQEHDAIFVRPNLHSAVERCALAHEIVHFENNDIDGVKSQENRADRIAARRLIRLGALEKLAEITEDPGVVALELNITEKIMRIYMGALSQSVIRR